MDIIIFGTGSASEKLKKMLHKKVNIIAYVDNNRKTWGMQKDNVLIRSPEEISNINYDYVVIASQFGNEIKNKLLELSIAEERIIDFYFIINKEFNWVKSDLFGLSVYDYGFECLITGLSYARSGIKQQIVKYNSYNLAHASQGIEEDYDIIKFMLNKNSYNMRKLKFVMVVLSYYSFQYDLSLSRMKGIRKLYDDAFNVKEESEEYKAKLEVLKNIIEINLYEKVFFDNSDCVYKKYDWEKEGERVSKNDCNKHYPKTVEKNKEIFEKYLNSLKKNNITPIVIILPASSYYTRYFSMKLEKEFKEVIKIFQNKYNFQYLDYFHSSLFNEKDFKDVSHLNEKGAIKFTEMLNNDIEWEKVW